MSNTGYLEGMKCPRCENEGSFRIAVTTMATFFDDCFDDHDDFVWGEDSYIECSDCTHHGTVREFTVVDSEG